MKDVPVQLEFKSDEVREILQRALEIDDGRSALLSFEELRHAAREVGITDESLDRAIREITVSGSSDPVTRRSLHSKIIGFALAGTGAGIASVLLEQSYRFPFPIPIILLMMFSGFGMLNMDRKKTLRALSEFELKNAGLFAGFILTVVAVHALGVVGGAGQFTLKFILANMTMLWGAASSLGGAFVAVRSLLSKSGNSESGGVRISQTWKRTVRKKLNSWVDLIFAEARSIRIPVGGIKPTRVLESGSAFL